MNVLQLLNQKDIQVQVLRHQNTKGYKTTEEIQEQISRVTAPVKHHASIVKYMAIDTMCTARDVMKKAGIYKQMVKKNFEHAFDCHDEYESRLLHPCKEEDEHFFRVSELGDARERYREDFTDREYFNMWLDIGASAYEYIYPFINALYHKLYLKLKDTHKHAEAIAWVVVSQVCLEYAQRDREVLFKQLSREVGIPVKFLNVVFRSFRVDAIEDAWCSALCNFFPEYKQFSKEIKADRNIEISIEQVREKLNEATNSKKPVRTAVEDNSDIYRNKKMFKEEIRNINSL